MSNNDKLLLTQGVATIRCQVIVKATDKLPEIVLSEQNSVKDWTYTDERYVPKQGFIGQFVARTLSGNLQNINDDFNIEGREIELRIGIVSNKNTNWYSLGNFIITDPTDNDVVDNTKFEAMDYTKLFNKKFDGDFKGTGFTQSYNEIINNKGTVTAIWLAKYCCAQVNVEFGQTTFTNSDFVINQNPFQAGETCRDVLKEISKLAYSWVRIGWDNKCYIDFEPVSSNTVSEENIITNNHYYTLETRKELYGPINNVVVGMSGIDGESHSEKDPNSKPSDGEHTIYIYDNPLTNTFELRALAQKKASKLFGLQFAQVSTETIGHPWLQANEKINVKNMENVDNYTYPFNRTIKFTGHIRTTIDSMADSEVEATLAYESEIMKSIKKASATVDKQNGVINLLVEDVKATQEAVENIDGTINPVGVGEGEHVYIEDASDKPLMNLQIEGKSTQATNTDPVSPSPDYPSKIESVGYRNLLDLSKCTSLNCIINNDGTIKSNISNHYYCELFADYLSSYFMKHLGETFTFSVEPIITGKQISIVIHGTRSDGSTYQEISATSSKSVSITIADNFTNITSVRIRFNRNSSTFTDTETVFSNLMLTKGNQLHSYIPYGKYGIEVETDGKNKVVPFGFNRTHNGLNFIYNIDGSLKIQGTSTGVAYAISTNQVLKYTKLKAGTYILSGGTTQIPIRFDDKNGKNITSTTGSKEFTLTEETEGFIQVRVGSGVTIDETLYPMIRVSNIEDDTFEPYHKNTSLFVLDQPLRSLPNGVKDIAYIKNNKLYVDRKVGSKIFDGSENWYLYEKNIYVERRFGLYDNKVPQDLAMISNYFKCGGKAIGELTDLMFWTQDDYWAITDINSKWADATEFKSWLSTHNTQVDYELETPVTEEYELTEKPSTFAGFNNIYINNNPQPNIYVEYVRDNAISKYVEQHVSELRITENEIKASVSSVEEYAIESKNNTDKTLKEIGTKFDNYVTNDTYITLEKNVTQLQTDTYTKTEINTKLIDGSVTKVMTTSGTFDEDGMHYEKTNAPTSSTINEVGVRVDSTTSGQELLFAGYDNDLKQTIVRTENLTVRKYFVVGNNSRIENYGNGGGIFII